MKYALDKNIKTSLYRALKKGTGFKWSKLLGYDLADVRIHLEGLFKKDMNWENYGSVWGITFFIPRRLYRFSSLKNEEFKKCWSLKNLKPELIINCYRQKKIINMEEVDKYSLYDILPIGKLKI